MKKIQTIAENRKDVVKALCEITGENSKYLGVPSCGYQVGECIVNKAGEIEIPDDEKLEALILSGLMEKGLLESEEFGDGMEIKVPMEEHTGLSLKNLVFMINSKQYLLNKALGRKAFLVDKDLLKILQETEPEGRDGFLELLHSCQGNEKNRGFYFTDDEIIFEAFPFSENLEEMRAYTKLASSMCAKALDSKRVNPVETIEENEKYYMRIWLLRLELGGAGGKETRRVMLENLKGHSAFRTQEEIERAKIRNRERAEAKKQAEPTPDAHSIGTASNLFSAEADCDEVKTEPTDAA